MIKKYLFWFVIVPIWLISTVAIYVIASVRHAPVGITLLYSFEVAVVCAGLFFALSKIYSSPVKHEISAWEISIEDVKYFKYNIKIGSFWVCLGQPSKAMIAGRSGFYIPVYFCTDTPSYESSKTKETYAFNITYDLNFRRVYDVIALALIDTFPDADPLDYRVDAKRLRGLEEGPRYIHLIYLPGISAMSQTLAYEYQLRLPS